MAREGDAEGRIVVRPAAAKLFLFTKRRDAGAKYPISMVKTNNKLIFKPLPSVLSRHQQLCKGSMFACLHPLMMVDSSSPQLFTSRGNTANDRL